eukprot:SAG22_NODE_98_length_20720_cov_17.226662_14_plen_566_part_00
MRPAGALVLAAFVAQLISCDSGVPAAVAEIEQLLDEGDADGDGVFSRAEAKAMLLRMVPASGGDECVEGWQGELCDECAPGYGGDTCARAELDEDCAEGWQGEDCDECAPGFSGELCTKSAAVGAGAAAAEEEACVAGWQGEDCDECAPGFSGELCSKTAAAAPAVEACLAGWQGEDCDECAPGFSGELCTMSAAVGAGAPAAEEEACVEGWQGEDCDECAPGFSGELCTRDGVAGGGVPATAAAMAGVNAPPYDEDCEVGWAGEDCDHCAPGYSGPSCKKANGDGGDGSRASESAQGEGHAAAGAGGGGGSAGGGGRTIHFSAAPSVQLVEPPPAWDPNGYIVTHYCQGRFGNQVSRKALRFCCASTVFLSKTVPFLAVRLSRNVNQFDYLLGIIEIALKANRTLVLPPFTDYSNKDTSGRCVRHCLWLPCASPQSSSCLRQCLPLRLGAINPATRTSGGSRRSSNGRLARRTGRRRRRPGRSQQPGSCGCCHWSSSLGTSGRKPRRRCSSPSRAGLRTGMSGSARTRSVGQRAGWTPAWWTACPSCRSGGTLACRCERCTAAD